MHTSTRAMIAFALMLIPTVGTGAIQAGTPNYGALSQASRQLCNMTCSDQTIDLDSSGGMVCGPAMGLTEITGRLTYRQRHFFLGSILLDLSPCHSLSVTSPYAHLDVFQVMAQVLQKHLGQEVTVSGMLSADGCTLMLASIAGEAYRTMSS